MLYHTLQLCLPKQSKKSILRFSSNQYIIDDNSIDIINYELLPPIMRYMYDKYNNITQALNHFLLRRTIPTGRLYSREILNRFGFSQIPLPNEVLKIQVMCNSLSPNDYYTLHTEGFYDIKQDHFQRGLDKLALTGRSNWNLPENQNTVFSYELSTDGVYAKCWQIENEVPYLYKAGTKGNYEAEAEETSSKIADIIGLEHVSYTVENLFGVKCSKCESMLTQSKSIVMFNDVSTEYMGINNLAGALTLSDIENIVMYANGNLVDFYNMLVFDYIVGNRDRHGYNWGFYFDHNKNQYDGMFPIFDNNNSIDPKDTAIYSPMLRGRKTKELAGYAVRQLKIKNKMLNIDKLMDWYNDSDTLRYFKSLYKSKNQLNYLKDRLSKIMS